VRGGERGAARRLTLSRETVRELDRTELENVAGGQTIITNSLKGCPLSITACDCTGNYTYQGC
jgi:hypothetical protein